VNKEKSQDTCEFVAAAFIAGKSTVFLFHLAFVCVRVFLGKANRVKGQDASTRKLF
jgi:hypothetical protein